MSTIGGNKDLRGAEVQRSPKLRALMSRWREALADIRASPLFGDRRRRTDANRRGSGAPECAPGGQLSEVAEDGSQRIGAEPHTGDDDTCERELVPLPTDRAQALAHLCDLLLQELDRAEVMSAEIRFAVHRKEHPGDPQLEPSLPANAVDLIRELRRLIASSGGTIADVARALETRGADLDETARELLRDELATLDADLATLNVHLADAVDWDTEFECLLAGEVAPFDDPAGREDDEDDERDD
jgi:hypothetical protein